MTDVHLSITLDANQAKRSVQDFRVGYQALTTQLQQPLGNAGAMNQVQAGAQQANSAVNTLSGSAGRQRAVMAGLAAQHGQSATSTRQLADAQRKLGLETLQTTQAVERQARVAGARAAAMGRLGSAIGGTIGTYLGVQTIAAIASTADAYNLMNARLKLATSSQGEFNTAQQELARIAAATAAPVESLVTLYGRISRPLKEAGRSQGQILEVTEAVATAFRVSGATAAEAQNGVIQFAQALGAGALRGDEFNSVAEQAPRLMTALAAGLGVSVSALKGMAAEGQLTADVVTDALISQLSALKEEAQSLPDTVGGAMTRLSDEINQAVGSADVSSLVTAIDKLGATIADPVVTQNIITLASGLLGVAAAAANAASEFADLGKRAGYFVAAISGNVTELDRIDQAILDIQRSLDGWTLNDLLYSDDELRAKLAALQAERALLLVEQGGLTEDQGKLQEQANAVAETLNKQKAEALRSHADDMKTLRDQLVDDAKTALKAEQKAEKDAIKALEKIKEGRLQLEKTFNTSIAQTKNGPVKDKGPSYNAAEDLKVQARQSLVAGETAESIEQAKAALRVLEQLEEAGENTRGFAGFKAELRDIALAAKDLEQTEAEAKIADIGTKIASLEQQTVDLEKLEITPTLSDEAVDAVTTQLQALAETLGQTLSIPVRLIPGTADEDGYVFVPNNPTPPEPIKRATGGWIDGPGSPTSDSILVAASRHEFMLNAHAARGLGAANLEFMNRTGQLPARDPFIPDIPALPQDFGRMGERQPLNLAMPWGGSYALEGTPNEVLRFQDDLERARVKFGGRS